MDERLPRLSIGDLARHAGCRVETVRYYERVGLLAPRRRSPGGHRLYAVDDLKRLTFIRRARALGFGLDDVRALLALVDTGDYDCAEVRQAASDQLAALRAQIADLRRMEAVLTDMTERCDTGRGADCPIVEALFEDDGGDATRR